jgi:hypothetical protein
MQFKTYQLSIVFIFLLLLNSLLFAYLLSKNKPNKNTPEERTSALNVDQKQAIVTYPPKASGQRPRVQKEELLKKLLSDTTPEEKQQQEILLKDNAQETAIIFIEKDCETVPTVAKIVGVDQVKIINEDTTEHVISFGQQETYTIKPDITTTIPLSKFKKGELNTYTCDGKEMSGYVYVP